MTIRSIILGLLGAAFVCGFTYLNDHIIRQTYMVGSCMPPVVFGGAVLLLIAANPLLRRIRAGWELKGTEIAVMIALTLAACCVPSAGLMECFPDTVMMPHRIAKTDASWKAEGIVDDVPPYMLADLSHDGDRALNGYVQGLSSGTERIGVGDVPWGAWTRTLAFWLPLVLVFWLGLMGLAMVVHRQWSRHEHLPYPIATFVNHLLPGGAEGRGSVFGNRLFWYGMAAICGLHFINYTARWWPEHLVSIPTIFDFTSLRDVWLGPTLARGGGWAFFRPRLYFTVIGLAILLPSDISFSLGIGPLLYALFAGVLAGFGISMTEGSLGWYSAGLRHALQTGAYVGMFLMIVYTGRRYYASVFRAAFGARHEDEVGVESVWGARIFMGCALVFTVMLIASGIDWILAIAFTGLAFLMFTVIGRISAESGYIFIQPYWEPAAMLVGFLGFAAIGPTTALLLFLVSTVVMIDTREPLVPFILNAFRFLDPRDVPVKRTARYSVIALLVGLTVAVPVTLYLKYDQGTDLSYRWGSDMVPRFSFNAAVKIKQRLRGQGRLEKAESASGFSRVWAMAPSGKLVIGFVVALALFLGLSALRLRVSWWPLHPILLLLWGVGPASWFAISFLVGFVLKRTILKYGGDAAYRKLMPIVIGVIAGDMLFGVSTSIVGGIYYLITGDTPPHFSVLIG